ncbi:hypothetical protein BM535_22480, partial [Clostridioides difficile]
KKFNDYLDIQFLQLPEEIRNEVLYGHYENGKKKFLFIKGISQSLQKGRRFKWSLYYDCLFRLQWF